MRDLNFCTFAIYLHTVLGHPLQRITPALSVRVRLPSKIEVTEKDFLVMFPF